MNTFYQRTHFIPVILLLLILVLFPQMLLAAPVIITVDSTGDVGRYTSLVLNGNNPVISYYDSTNADLKVAVCDDATCPMPTLTIVDSAGNVGWYRPALALNGSGHPIISYVDLTNGDLKVAVCTDATCITPTLTTVDSADDVGYHSSMMLNGRGYPVISYYDLTNRDLKLAVCNDATCTAPTIRTIDSPGDVEMYTSLVRGNRPIISYYDNTNGNLKLAVCNNATCTAPTIRTIDSAGNVGRYLSMALNSSGNPVISYLDGTNRDLKLAVCNNATCTAPTIRTIDSAGDVGGYTSLALNGNNPVISYYDVTNGDLKLAVCNNATCTAPIINTVDSADNVGGDTSLALNSKGYPVISYYDYTNLDLKLVVCISPTCIEYDFGDAPDPSYPTLFANSGAQHTLGSAVYLGTCVDYDKNAQPNTPAAKDDRVASTPVFGTCVGGDDEDGVVFTSTLMPGTNATVDVTANAACILSGWIDFSDDGDWDDAGENIFSGESLVAGINNLSFFIPTDAALGNTYARFRCTTDGPVAYTGLASDGEVEDYRVWIGEPIPPATGSSDDDDDDNGDTVAVDDGMVWEIILEANPVFALPGDSVTFTITIRKLSGGTPITMQFPISDSFAIQSVTSNRGSASTSGQDVIFTDEMHVGDEAVITVNTVLSSGLTPPYMLTEEACITSPVALCDSAVVSSVSQLPATGETPLSQATE